MGFCASGAEGKTSAFVLLSSPVQADGILSANEQIINFFILHSTDGSGRRNIEFPTCTKPCTLADILCTTLGPNTIT